jgi:hypothetical protein
VNYGKVETTLLRPILVTGLGRSGTTAMMSLLGTGYSIAFNRVYPYEKAHLTNLAKLFLLVDRRDYPLEFEPVRMRHLNQKVLDPPRPLSSLPDAATMDLFPPLWEIAGRKIASKSSEFYAEKAPDWLGPFVAPGLSPFTIRLFRDPRDNFISSLAFMRKNGHVAGFGREQSDSEETFARTLCRNWLSSFEAWAMTRSDPDAIMSRYEDFVSAPQEVASELNRRLCLNLDPQTIEELPQHRTALTNNASIGRHRAEPLSTQLAAIFDECLGEEMAALNYRLSPRPYRFPRIHFTNFLPLSCNDGAMTRAIDRARTEITGPDFFFMLPLEAFNAEDVHSIWLSVLAPIGDHCSVYWRRGGEVFSEERAVHHQYFPGRQWRILDFKCSSHPLWTGMIVELRFDLFNFTGQFVPGFCETTWFRLIPR